MTALKKLKKFYSDVSVNESNNVFSILLDGRELKTPQKKPLTLINKKIADAIAQEWSKQDETIDHSSMPLTSLAFTALDLVEEARDKVIDEVINFTHTDTSCCWVEDPKELRQQQLKTFLPLIQWFSEKYSIPLQPTETVFVSRLDDNEFVSLRNILNSYDPYHLTAVFNMTNIFKSLVLTMALINDSISMDEAWTASQLEESFQIKKWGETEEIKNQRDYLLKDLKSTYKFWTLLN